MSEWILPEERLPEDEQNVLITIKANTAFWGGVSTEDEVFIAMFHEAESDEKWFSCNHFTIWDCEDTELTKEVLAWMPLPEPYAKR